MQNVSDNYLTSMKSDLRERGYCKVTVESSDGTLEYDNDTISSVTVTSYFSPTSEDLPQVDGEVTLVHEDGEFELDNPDSITNYLVRGQAVTIQFGYATPEVIATIDYYSNYSNADGSLEDDTISQVYNSDEFTVPDCIFDVPDGYEFKYWTDTDGNIFYPGDTAYFSELGYTSTTFKAVWQLSLYTLILNSNYESLNDNDYQEESSVTITVSSSATSWTAPSGTFSADGHTLLGWYISATYDGTTNEGYFEAGALYDLADLITYVNSSNYVTLYAVWQSSSYTLILNSNYAQSDTGYSSDEDVTWTYTLSSGGTWTAPTYSSTYDFYYLGCYITAWYIESTGWSSSADGSFIPGTTYSNSELIEYADSSDTINLYAVWAFVYQVEYYDDDGTSLTYTHASYSIKFTTLTNTDVSKSGYSLSGWSTSADSTGTILTLGVSYIAADYMSSNGIIYLYAVWEVVTLSSASDRYSSDNLIGYETGTEYTGSDTTTEDDIEWLDAYELVLDSWEVSDTTFTLTCVDKIRNESDSFYTGITDQRYSETREVDTNYDLGNLVLSPVRYVLVAKYILAEMGIDDYILATKLSYHLTKVYLPVDEHKVILQQIANLCTCSMLWGRNGQLKIKDSPTKYDVADYTLNRHEMTSTPIAQLNETYTSIEITKHDYSGWVIDDYDLTDSGDFNDFLTDNNEDMVWTEVTVDASEVYYDEDAQSWTVPRYYGVDLSQPMQYISTGDTYYQTMELDSGETVFYAGYADKHPLAYSDASSTVTDPDDETITFTYGGLPLEETESIYTLVLDDDPEVENVLSWDNPLVCTPSEASTLAIWLARYHSDTFVYDLETRGEPELDVGDVIYVETNYGTIIGLITEQTITFNESFSGKLKILKLDDYDDD